MTVYLGFISHPQTRADKQFSLVTTSVTADQSVGSYTITSGKIYGIQSIFVEVLFTAVSATATKLGTITVRETANVIAGPVDAVNPTSSAPFGFVIPVEGLEEILGDGTKTVNVICTPAVVTSITWRVSIIGYERS